MQLQFPIPIYPSKGVNSQTPPWNDTPFNLYYVHGVESLEIPARQFAIAEGRGLFTSFGPARRASDNVATGLFVAVRAGVPGGFIRLLVLQDDGTVGQTSRAFFDGVPVNTVFGAAAEGEEHKAMVACDVEIAIDGVPTLMRFVPQELPTEAELESLAV